MIRLAGASDVVLVLYLRDDPSNTRCMPVSLCLANDPAGRYKWDTLPADLRPERGLLGLRAGLGAFANLRPATVLPQVTAGWLVATGQQRAS